MLGWGWGMDTSCLELDENMNKNGKSIFCKHWVKPGQLSADFDLYYLFWQLPNNWQEREAKLSTWGLGVGRGKAEHFP